MNPPEKPPDDAPEEEFARIVRRVAPRREPAPPEPSAGLWESARTVLGRVVAALSFDSRATAPQASGMRARGSDTRHLLFSAKGRDIDLRIVPSADGFALSGQVLGPGESGSVHLATCLRGAARSQAWQAATLDDLGEFHIDALVAGTYEITLRLGGDEIALPPIDVDDKRA